MAAVNATGPTPLTDPATCCLRLREREYDEACQEQRQEQRQCLEHEWLAQGVEQLVDEVAQLVDHGYVPSPEVLPRFWSPNNAFHEALTWQAFAAG